MRYRIPFNKPFVVGKELYYIAKTVLENSTAGNGVFTQKCQKLIEDQFNADKVLLTTSCTTALEMAAILCDVQPGDEVILPSFTFVSTANAFYMRGASLKFIDIRKDTLNLDENGIEALITENTKTIVPMHYAGIGCEMDRIMDLAGDHHLLVVEDAAQAVNSKFKGRHLGTFGDIGTYSFHETKNFICGEGGAIVINNPNMVERAEIIWEKGTNRSQFFRGEVDKYTWVDIGSSFLPSDILAAFLYAQLENMTLINQKRGEIFDFYYRELIPLANNGMLRIPYVSVDCEANSHLFYVILRSQKERDDLVDFLKEEGILSVFHYIPLHLSPMGRKMGYKEGDLPVTESISYRLLRLPFYFEITKEEQMAVVSAINRFFNG